MRRLPLRLLPLFAALAACSTADPAAEVEFDIAQYEPAPLVALLANPERFDGKMVRVEGFLRLEFEGDAVYLGKQDYDAGLTTNALWVDCRRFEVCRSRDEDASPLKQGYAEVVGTFHARNKGHLGLFSGEIGDVVRLAPTATRQDFADFDAWERSRVSGWPLWIVYGLGLVLAVLAGLVLGKVMARRKD